MSRIKKFLLVPVLLTLLFLHHPGKLSAEESISVLYVPLIGLTTVSIPPGLPNGPGDVTLKYAVKSFLREIPLTGVQVVDDLCRPVKFLTGDDNGNGKLDYDETWRFSCKVKLEKSSISTATVTGAAGNITATHRALAPVLVGSQELPPLISIVNTTKVSSPLQWSKNGAEVNFSYKVNNPGSIPLSLVEVKDDRCGQLSGRLGDTNGNGLLDINEVWIYTCRTFLDKTTTNTATVTAWAEGLKAFSETSLTVEVNRPPEVRNNTARVIVIVLAALILARLINGWHKINSSNKR